MIQVFYGKKGSGKTKALIASATEYAKATRGDVVFLNDSEKLIYEVPHQIRYINIATYPIDSDDRLLGFISGLLAGNYDLHRIYVDRLTYITQKKHDDLQTLFESLQKLGKENDVEFVLSLSGEDKDAPAYVKEYIQ